MSTNNKKIKPTGEKNLPVKLEKNTLYNVEFNCGKRKLMSKVISFKQQEEFDKLLEEISRLNDFFGTERLSIVLKRTD